jgi:hypothetical protein
MAIKAYIFLALNKEAHVPFPDQKSKIEAFAAEIGLRVDEIFIENRNPLSLPFVKRQEGAKIMASLQPGDTIICLQAEWILATLWAASELLEALRKNGVSLYCVDFKENLSLDSKRKLVVSNGPANLIKQILQALILATEEPQMKIDELPQSEAEHVNEPDLQSGIGSVEYEESLVSDRVVDGANFLLKSESGNVQIEDDGPHLAEQPLSLSGDKGDEVALVRQRQQQFLVAEIQAMKRQGLAEPVMAQVLREKHGIWLSIEGIRKILFNKENTTI